MLNFLFVSALLMNPQGSKPAIAGQDYTGPRKRAAVTGFAVTIKSWQVYAEAPSGLPVETEMDIDQPDEVGEGMSDMLVTALIASKRFVVLERLDLKDIEDELKIQTKADYDPTSTVQIGSCSVLRSLSEEP